MPCGDLFWRFCSRLPVLLSRRVSSRSRGHFPAALHLPDLSLSFSLLSTPPSAASTFHASPCPPHYSHPRPNHDQATINAQGSAFLLALSPYSNACTFFVTLKGTTIATTTTTPPCVAVGTVSYRVRRYCLAGRVRPTEIAHPPPCLLAGISTPLLDDVEARVIIDEGRSGRCLAGRLL